MICDKCGYEFHIGNFCPRCGKVIQKQPPKIKVIEELVNNKTNNIVPNVNIEKAPSYTEKQESTINNIQANQINQNINNLTNPTNTTDISKKPNLINVIEPDKIVNHVNITKKKENITPFFIPVVIIASILLILPIVTIKKDYHNTWYCNHYNEYTDNMYFDDSSLFALDLKINKEFELFTVDSPNLLTYKGTYETKLLSPDKFDKNKIKRGYLIDLYANNATISGINSSKNLTTKYEMFILNNKKIAYLKNRYSTNSYVCVHKNYYNEYKKLSVAND